MSFSDLGTLGPVMEYFLTGATGFIGGHVAHQLLDDGHDIIALARTPSRAGDLEAAGATVVEGDITEKETLRDPMEGVDGVFHVAGWYDVDVTVQDERGFVVSDPDADLRAIGVGLYDRVRVDIVIVEPADDELRAGALVPRWVLGLDLYEGGDQFSDRRSRGMCCHSTSSSPQGILFLNTFILNAVCRILFRHKKIDETNLNRSVSTRVFVV